MSIESKLKEYAALEKKRWHTPGHKGCLDALDLTEIGQDGEIFPSDAVEIAQRRAAQFYGARHCRFLVNGSSGGIKAAVLACGGDIIAPKNRHRCVDEGARLGGVKVFDIESEMLSDGLYAPPTAEEVSAAMEKHKSAKAVVIVSPDYYGVTACTEITKAVHSAGKLLIADSAHGAHFAARPDLFPKGFASVADFCVMSAHKTMNAYTQSSYMCINNDDVLESADECLKLLGTTSPSYILLAGLENAIDYAEKNADRYDALKTAAEEFKKTIVCRRSDDFTRIVVDAAAYGLTGRGLFERLYENGHTAEMFDNRFAVFIETLADSPEDIGRLKESILRVTKR